MTSIATKPSVRRYFLLFASVLLFSVVLRIPVICNFQFMAFFDPGTAFHGIDLLAKGYSPSVDFGYTHGLLSLDFSRVWIGVIGKNPVAFISAIAVLEVVIAWGLARLAARFDLGRAATVFFCCILPWAVIPDYLTLTHPLEAAILVHALAEQAAERRPRALALLTLCLFVKPSMAYVYGLVLVLIMLREGLRREDLQVPGKLWAFFKELIPAGVTLMVCAAAVLRQYGATPVKNTLFAVAGASAYKETNFGLFFGDGRHFWLPLGKTTAMSGIPAVDIPAYYVVSPATIWMVATVALMVMGAFYLIGYFSGPRKTPRRRAMVEELIVTLAIIHSAFIFVFYGWENSWTYYAYMPFFALALMIDRLHLHKRIVLGLTVLACLSHIIVLGIAFGAWTGTVRTRETGGLFAWKEQAQSFKEVLEQTAGEPTLLMTNGYPFYLPANVRIPDAWFPETGIALPVEIARVREQALASRYVIIFFKTGDVDLWLNSKFADVRDKFHRVALVPRTYGGKDDLYRNSDFEIWERNGDEPQMNTDKHGN